MAGDHCIKTWSTNQQVVALSSGEAEFYGIVKGGSNALGISGMFRDMGIDFGIRIKTDSSAAKGIANRRGLDKVRHIELTDLWIQDQAARGKMTLVKMPGVDNHSDRLTKHSTPEHIAQPMRCDNQQVIAGRHPIMPHVAK